MKLLLCMQLELLLVDNPNTMQDCGSCGTGGELQLLGICCPCHVVHATKKVEAPVKAI